MYAAVLSVSIMDIQARLYDIKAELVSSYSISSDVFDMLPGRAFIPPIYRSSQFRQLFDSLTEYTARGGSLEAHHLSLTITKSRNQFRVCIFSNKETLPLLSIHLVEWQYQKMVEVLLAGGMQCIRSYQQNVKLYLYKPLQTVSSIFQSNDIPTFLYVHTDKEESIIQSLALLNISMDKTVNYSLKEVYTYYNIPICLF